MLYVKYCTLYYIFCIFMYLHDLFHILLSLVSKFWIYGMHCVCVCVCVHACMCTCLCMHTCVAVDNWKLLLVLVVGNFVFAKSALFQVMFAFSSGHIFVLSTCDNFCFLLSHVFLLQDEICISRVSLKRLLNFLGT